MKIVIGCDNAAVDLKNIIKAELEKAGIEVDDVGVATAQDDALYPDVADTLCKNIIESGYEKEGILICGTGIGMAICANKHPGIYAAVCHDSFSAERARLSNNANVLCVGARVIGVELAKKVLKEWLANKYVPGTSSQPKVDAMRNHEKSVFK